MKYFYNQLIPLSFLLVLVVTSCQQKEKPFNRDSEKIQVEKAIHNSIGWAKTKDINLLYEVI